MEFLHGVLDGEVHETCCMGCMLSWMGSWCRGVNTLNSSMSKPFPLMQRNVVLIKQVS